MARSPEEQYNVHYPTLAAAGLVLLAGLLIQLFIVVVNITDWVKGRPKTPVDQILTSLGMTRIFLHSFTFIDTLCVVFIEGYMKSEMQVFLYLTGNSSNLSDIWLGVLFSVIFCMKICNFHNAFFLYLKTFISRRVVLLIVALVFVSICYISLFLVTDYIILSHFLRQNFTTNETQLPEITHVYIFVTMGNSMPFLIYCISSLLLIFSLCFHVKKMKSNSNVSTNLDSYYKAIQFMTFCLFGFMLRIGSNIVVLHLYFSLDIVWLFVIWNSVAILNSIYLIYRTNKLSKRLSKILSFGTTCVFHRQTDSVSNSETKTTEETTTTF